MVQSGLRSALEAKDGAEVAAKGLELFDQNLCAEALAERERTGAWRRHAPAVVAGERKMFDVVEVATEAGAAGIANDLTEVESLRAEMERHTGAYSRMLDQLSTAVAIFDRAKRLTFYNAAYRQIWSLDAGFLDSHPTDGEVLDRLRAKRQLPEQADFRSWKAQALAAYQAIEPIETVWHLPDGRALRVVASPNPQGGVTYLFDDATQSYALASQVNALTRVQGETLDALKEGVAVFGADGRMKLINPAFAALWRFEPERAVDRPHIDEVVRHCAPLLADSRLWDGLRATIVGLPEDRRGFEMRVERNDGLVLDCAALPLPDGATLLTFLDATAGANVERALTERNQALVSAEKLRNDFVNHVSYELRTPLTNIIGFTQLLADGGVGPLNPKQLEYAGFITTSSAALLAIINDILDLASIDAGALELRPEDVDVVEAMKAAAEGVQDRFERIQDRAAHRRHRRRRLAARRRAARPPGSVQPALQRDRLFRARPDRDPGGDAPGRRNRIQGQRPRPRHCAGGARARVRPLREPQQRFAPSRPGPRPVDRAGAGRIARRPGPYRFGAGRGDDGDVRFPY